MPPDYLKYLVERYQGELYGEALFRSLAAHTRDEEKRAKWKVLEQLERETKELIRPVVTRHGYDTAEDQERRARGERHGKTLADRPWPEFLRDFRAELERFVGEFERAEELAPTEARGLLEHITRHERALLEFATREIDGRADSLEPVLALLAQPPAAG